MVTLRGDLGAGKTAWVKALAQGWGLDPAQIQSPTFLKLLEYRIPKLGLCVHIDAYRIEDNEGFEKLSLETYDEARVWCVEWPDAWLKYLAGHEALRKHLGFTHYWDIAIALEADGSRRLTVERKHF